MTRSLTVTWEDPLAAFEQGKKLTPIDYLRAITLETGTLRASARVVHMGSRTATAEGKLEDASGKLYAHGTTTCLIISGQA